MVLGKVDLTEEVGLTLRGETKVLKQLEQDAWFEETQNKIISAEDIEDVVNNFYEKVELLKKKYSKKKSQPQQKPQAWWSIDLEIERKRVRASIRRYQKARGEIRKSSR